MVEPAPLHPAAREHIAKWFDEAWSEGLWAASWSKSIEGLTAAQAAWSPAPGRHSIWQIVLHMVFWRESHLKRLVTGEKHTEDEYKRLNFPEIAGVSEAAWDEARRRFADTQSRMSAALRNPDARHDILTYFLPHDSYHIGQINYLRAMQGLKFLE